MKYFQCSKGKELLELEDSKFDTNNITQTNNNVIQKVTIKPANLNEIICHGRRMRELTKDQYDHEYLQRDYVGNGGSGPSDTAEMQRLKINV